MPNTKLGDKRQGKTNESVSKRQKTDANVHSSKKQSNSFHSIKNNTKKFTKTSNSTEKKSFVDQKMIHKQRKMQRPHYDMVTRAKAIWNIIRERDVDKKKRETLVQELFHLVQGKMYDVAAKHDASRVIQALLKYSSPFQRSLAIQELQDHILELSKMQYGYFLVQKMLKYGSKEDRQIIMKQLKGHVVTIATHNIAANVFEYAQEYLQPAQLSTLKLEFYGKEFAYFKDEFKEKTLSTILKASNMTQEKRMNILVNIQKTLNRMVEKQLLGLAFVQSLLWEFMCHADHDMIMNMIANVRDGSLALLATRNGARCVATCLAMGSPKDKKRVIKALKDKMLEACNHHSGYLVLLRLLDVVDDAVLVQKSVLSELTQGDNLVSIALDPNGCKVLLQAFSPLNSKYLSQSDLELLKPPMIPAPVDENTDSKANPMLIVNYKKSPEARQQDILKVLLPKLQEICADKETFLTLIRSKTGRDVLVEVLKASDTDAKNLEETVVNAITQDNSVVDNDDVDMENEQVPLHDDAIAHSAIKRIAKETKYAAALLQNLSTEQLKQYVGSNRGCFVVLGFLEAQHLDPADTRKKVKLALKGDAMKQLKVHSKKQAGARLVLENLEQN